MIGAIIGDIVGSRFEFKNHKSKEFELFTADCFATDDSIMTLAIARAIMETLKHPQSDDSSIQLSSNAVKYMQEIGRKYPDCGFGGNFIDWVFDDNPEPYNSFGNGAAMRISPAGFAARSLREAGELARDVTGVTHNHEEGMKGAAAVAEVIFMAKSGHPKGEIRSYIEEHYYKLDFTIDEIRPSYRFDVSCQGTIPQAIKAFLESESFEDAIRTAVSLGGDSDTLAAITGSIAEAYYGVPEDLKEKALTYLNDELREIYDEWIEMIGD